MNDPSTSVDGRSIGSTALRALGFLVSFLVALPASFVAILVSTNKFFSPDVGIGVVFAWGIGIPVAMLLAFLSNRLLFRHETPTFRACLFPLVTALFAALLGPLIIAILLRVV